MLFYIKCPTCSRVISEDLDKFYDDLEAILDDPNNSSTKKDILYSKLLDKYNFKHICCRIRIMGLIPYHKIIIS